MTVKVLAADGFVSELLMPLGGHKLEECYPADLLAQALDAPNDVVVGWATDGKNFSPAIPPAPKAIVPAQVTRAQAKIQLRLAGLRDKAEALIAKSDLDVQDWYAEAGTWRRSNIYVAQIGKALGLKDSDIDALFISAAQIDA